MCKFDLDYVSEVRGKLCGHITGKCLGPVEDCAKHVRVQARLPVSGSDRRLGGHSIRSC